jgi:molybdopterin-guanine dinucleotide biosynthesis adapter protein
MVKKLPILGICAAGSNSGKTTLLEKLLAELNRRGIRVSVIKHAHHKFDIDYPGKDSYRIREAGAVQTLVASANRRALMTEMQRTPNPADEVNLDELIAALYPDYADLILVEGFKNATIPKIEVHRPQLGMPLLCRDDKQVIAVASDAQIQERVDIPILDLNNPSQITDFILRALHLK